MLYNGIFLNYDNLVQIAAELKQKIDSIESCYRAVKEEMKEIDGTNNNWQGEDQKIFYEALENFTSKYDDNINKLNEIHKFLCTIIDNYKTRDENFEKDLDRNKDNLDM